MTIDLESRHSDRQGDPLPSAPDSQSSPTRTSHLRRRNTGARPILAAALVVTGLLIGLAVAPSESATEPVFAPVDAAHARRYRTLTRAVARGCRHRPVSI